MPTRNGSSSSQSLRSDLPARAGVEKVDQVQLKKELSPYIKDKDYGNAFNTPTDSTVKKIAGIVDEINHKIFPKKRNLIDLSPADFNRYNSVNNDTEVGSSKVNKELERLNLQGTMDSIAGGSKARDYIVALANEVMKDAFLGGRKDFSDYAVYRFGVANSKFGQEVAGELMRLGLEEGFDRMKRAGLVYQENDPRLKK